MIFPEKLQLIRKNKGLTQEALAELLAVSRQAVAKWEAGQGYPDIENLIRLSALFCVTVDYLVKDDVCQKQPEMIMSADVAQLTRFLVTAKQHTYAGKGPESEPTRPQSHDLAYREGDFLYIDTYLGGERFSGEEAVWHNDVPVFALNYSGRVLHESFSGDFLKAALSAVPETLPFRGPAVFQDNGFVYRCSVTGDIAWFQGYEEIYSGTLLVYDCYFHGGTVQ